MARNKDLPLLHVPSVCLSRLLDRKGGTEDEVTIRRKVDSMEWYSKNVYDDVKFIYSGSRGEGLDFESSDSDLMREDKHMVVLNSIHDQKCFKKKKMLLMRREECKPGFVILQVLSPSNTPLVTNSIVRYHDIPVVSSLLLRDKLVSLMTTEGIHTEAHGPCSTDKIEDLEFDFAHCFACNTWPSEAHEFIHRQRINDWPRKKLLDRIICNGCHVVPIGDTGSDIALIQWRLSFSIAEKALVHSFTHTQLKVYILMKIFLKQAINTNKSVEGVLCSYFLKTLLFYTIESTPESFWTEELLISCFWLCFNKLIEWVEQGYCPNYFVPQNNMFRKKVCGEHQGNLLRVLNSYKHLGWTCLCQCEDLKSLQGNIEHEIIDKSLLVNKKEQEILMDKAVFQNLLEISFKGPPDATANCIKMLLYSRTRQEEDIAKYFLCVGLRRTALFYMSQLNKEVRGTNTEVRGTNTEVRGMNTEVRGTNTAVRGTNTEVRGTNNKRSYALMRKCSRILNISKVTDICSGYLNHATFFYSVGNYKEAIQNCEKLVSLWKPFVVYGGVEDFIVPEGYKQRICGQNLRIQDKMRMALADDFKVEEDFKYFYPLELHHDIQAASSFSGVLHIPPLPYTIFLMFLCHHRLGNIDKSLSALQDLRTLVHERCERNFIVLNFLAICLDKIGDVHGAIDACFESLGILPVKNGASSRLQQLLSRDRR